MVNIGRITYLAVFSAGVLAVVCKSRSRLAALRQDNWTREAIHYTAISQFALPQELDALNTRESKIEAAERMYSKAEAVDEHYAAIDEERAVRNRKRARMDNSIFAEHDEQVAEKIQANILDKKSFHEQLMANISIDISKQQQIDAELAEYRQGKCGWVLLRTGCNLVGHVASLRKQDATEAAKIHDEIQTVKQTGQTLLMEELVAKILHDKATRYHETAAHLDEMADEWHNASVALMERARRENRTVHALENLTSTTQREMVRDQMWLDQAKEKVQRDLQLANRQHAYRCSYDIAAVILAVCTTAYFGWLVWAKIVVVTAGWHSTLPSERVFRLEKSVYHWLVFHLALGLVSTADWLVKFESDSSLDKADLILSFTIRATLMETLFLTFPWRRALAVAVRQPTQTWKPLVYYTCQCVALSLGWYLIEFLFVWTIFRPLFEQPGAVSAFRSWWFRSFGLSLLFWKSIHQEDVYFSEESSTIVVNGGTSTVAGASETSSLTQSGASLQTNHYVSVDLRSMEEQATASPSGLGLTSVSVLSVPFWNESFRSKLENLLLPLEILVLSSMLTIITITPVIMMMYAALIMSVFLGVAQGFRKSGVLEHYTKHPRKYTDVEFVSV